MYVNVTFRNPEADGHQTVKAMPGFNRDALEYAVVKAVEKMGYEVDGFGVHDD